MLPKTLARSPTKRNFEVEFFVKGSEGLSISELLQIPTEFRTFQHCKEILKHIKNVKFIEKYMNTDNIYELAKQFKLESFKEHYRICQQVALIFDFKGKGDDADKFYIILEGSVRVLIEHDAEYKGFKEEKMVNTLRRGDSFGEIALLYDVKRTASVITNERTECLVIDKTTFRKYFDLNLNPEFAHIIEFYKNFFPLYHLEPDQISALAGKSNSHKFGSDTILARQDTPAQTVFYVRSGRLKVIKKLWFKLKNGELNLDDPSDPTPQQIEAGKVKELIVEIDEILSGESVGDYEVLHKEDMKISVMTVIPSEIIMVYKTDIRALPDKILEQYMINCKAYPQDTDIRLKYLTQLKWTGWKEKLKKQIEIEVEHKKRDFPSRLRRPLMRKPRLEKLPVIIGSPQLQDGTLEVISPSRTRKEKALVDKNYDLDPGLQLLMNNDHYTFYRPHIRSGSTTATSFGLNRKSSVPLTNLSKLENNPLIQSRTHVPKYFKFEYTEPQHKSREASQNHSTTNISKLLNNNTTTNLNLISKEILSRDFSSVTPSPHPTQQAKKMVKFMERSSSIENLKSEATSEISRIVRGRKFDIIETNESVEEIIGSDKLRAKLEELKTIGI